jgi:hypothetical protein
MSLSISPESLKSALKESDVNTFLEIANRENNLYNKDGMTLRIPQDNFLDTLINTVDGRRIQLEKKAEILHDYYGDRLLAKDLFKDYLDQKFYKVGFANLLSAGLVGANFYSKLFKSSYLMGKVGTLATLAAVQCVGRTLSNNWLENHIDRAWKIHTFRQSKGMTGTNLNRNQHKEVLNMTINETKVKIIW